MDTTHAPAAPADISPGRLNLLLNVGHALDHLTMTIYPTVILALTVEFGGSYAELLPLSLGGLIAFGAFSLPAGWLGDRWSRRNMMAVFFFGLGVSTVLAGFAQSPWQLAAAMTLIGLFAAIYHPVGLAMLAMERNSIGRTLGVNGLWGNLGVAFAALAAGALTDLIDWRAAFIVPGLVSIAAGVWFVLAVPAGTTGGGTRGRLDVAVGRGVAQRIFAVLMVATIAGGVIFTATTVSMPKIFDERLQALTSTTFGIGALVCLVYVLAALAQLCVGSLIDRFDLRRVFVPVALAQVPLLALAGYLDNWALLAVAIAMMFVVFGQIPINDAMVARYTPNAWRARAFALRYIVSFGASSTAVPLVALLHGGGGGFRAVFWVLAAMAVATGLAALVFPGRDSLASPAAQPAE